MNAIILQTGRNSFWCRKEPEGLLYMSEVPLLSSCEWLLRLWDVDFLLVVPMDCVFTISRWFYVVTRKQNRWFFAVVLT